MLERGLAEAASDEREHAGHQVGVAVVEPAPRSSSSRSARRSRLRDVTGRSRGCRSRGGPASAPERRPARRRVERRPVGIRHQSPSRSISASQLVLRHALVPEPAEEARPSRRA